MRKKNIVITFIFIIFLLIGCIDPITPDRTIDKTSSTPLQTPAPSIEIIDWFEVTTDTVYPITHNLGIIPSRVEIRFKKNVIALGSTTDDPYELIVSFWNYWSQKHTGYGAYIAAGKNNVLIHTGNSGVISYSHINPENGKNENLSISSGFYKVLIWK